MSHILYGEPDTFGAGLWLNVLGLNYYQREAVYSNSDYLYTRHRLSVRALFNPGIQQEELMNKELSYLDQPPHVLPPTNPLVRPKIGPLKSLKIAPHSGNAVANRPAVYTAEAIKHVALQPRLRLRWWQDNQMILLSPLAGMVVDSTGGPRPISCDVAEIRSGKTWLLDWAVETNLNETPHHVMRPTAVLSHQFGQREDLDADYFRTLTTRGRVVFDRAVLETPDLLANGTLLADDMRSSIILPIPANMKRESVQVNVEPDGISYTYEVVDREKSLNWDEEGVTRVECEHSVSTKLPNLAIPGFNGLGAQEAIARANAAGGFMRGQEWIFKGLREWMFGPGFKDAGWLPNNNFAVNAITQFGGATAISYHTIALRVWGHRGVSRNHLEDFARRLVTQRIAPIKISMRPLLISSEVKHNVTSNHIAAQETYIAGPLRPIGGPLPTRDVLNARVFGNTNNTSDLLVEDPARRIQRPPADNLSRGTHVAALLHSVLANPGNPRNLPPDLPRAPKVVGAADVPIWPRPVNP